MDLGKEKVTMKKLFSFSQNSEELANSTITTQDHAGQIEAINKSQAVIQFKLDGTIISANQNFLTTMGYSLDEVEGKHHSIFVEQAVRSSSDYKQFWDKLARGEYVADIFKRIKKNGNEVWIRASYNPIMDKNGKPVKVVKYATDITEQITTMTAWESKLAAIDKSQAVIEFNLDGTVITANLNFLQTIGYSMSEIQGQPHSMFVDSEYGKSPEYREFWDSLRRGEYRSGEFMRVGKGGNNVWIQASYNPILDKSGKPLKVVKYASNITEQKQLQLTIEDVLEKTSHAMTAMSQGDLTTRMGGSFTGQFAVLQDAVNQCFEQLHTTLGKILWSQHLLQLIQQCRFDDVEAIGDNVRQVMATGYFDAMSPTVIYGCRNYLFGFELALSLKLNVLRDQQCAI